MPPGHLPKGVQIDPSWLQEVSFPLLNFDLVLGSILAPFGVDFDSRNAPLWAPFGTLWATKNDQTLDRKWRCLKCRSKILPRPPRTPPRAPKTSPGPPQETPKTPQDPPRCPKRPTSRPKLP